MKHTREDPLIRHSLAATCAAVVASMAQPGVAQDAPRETIRIDVTGSNIKRPEAEGALPLQIITREEIVNGGIQTAQELLERVSANQSFGLVNEALGEGSSLVGFTAASLRGLGSERTLVLLNGRRLAPYALSGGTSVDLSGVPASAIERVEILKDGASAVYGTDAIGGVINFILRKDFRGIEVNGNYFATEHGGGNNWRGSATVGYGELAKDRFNLFVSADHFEQKPLKSAQREFSRTSYVPSLGLDRTSPAAWPANIAQPPAIGRLVNPTIPITGATPESCIRPFSFPTEGSPRQCRFDFASVIETIPEAEKTNVIGRFTWQMDPAHQFFAETTYYRGKFIQRVSPTPVFPPPFSNTDNTLPPTSPYYPAAFVASLAGDPNQPIGLAYRLIELGPRVDDAKVDQWTVVAGLQGTLGQWDYQLSANWVRNQQQTFLRSGYVSDRLIGELLHSGIVNPFGVNSAVIVDRMRAAQIVGRATDNVASNYGGDVKVSRTITGLPAGPLALALGLEGRRESLEQSNSDAVVTGDIVGFTGQVPSLALAHRTVWALFAEVDVPLHKTLIANVALRHDRYSDFGGTSNPKVTVRWQPRRELVLRASYGTGFRAPTLADLFQPRGNRFADGAFDDPIRCPVTGTEYDCGDSFGNPIPYRVVEGGNPLLQPERSQQSNAGLVAEPVNGLSVAADYYRVEVRKLIFFVGTNAIFDNFALLESTNVVRRPPDAAHPGLPGEIDHLIQTSINAGNLRTSGIDVDVRYRAPGTRLGQFNAALSGTYVIDYRLRSFNAAEFPSGPGASGFLGAVARWRHYAWVDWTRGPWAATLAQTFQSGYVEPCAPADPSGCEKRRVGSYSIWDVQGRYSGFRGATLMLGVRNLFDTSPPVSNQVAAFQVLYDPSYADPRGRTYYATIRYALK